MLLDGLLHRVPHGVRLHHDAGIGVGHDVLDGLLLIFHVQRHQLEDGVQHLDAAHALGLDADPVGALGHMGIEVVRDDDQVAVTRVRQGLQKIGTDDVGDTAQHSMASFGGINWKLSESGKRE